MVNHRLSIPIITNRLVLFCRKDRVWKIADFGLSAEATSQHPQTTLFATGTPSYRAPELLVEDPKYTNKVDLWALGCILFELTTGKKAFAGDWAVHEYRISPYERLPTDILLTLSILPDVLNEHICGILNQLLDKNWKRRPRSAETSRTFHFYGILLSSLFLDSTTFLLHLPKYDQWETLLSTYATEEELRDGLVQFQNTSDEEGRYLERLAGFHELNGDRDAGMVVRMELFLKHPHSQQLLAGLYRTYRQNGHYIAVVASLTDVLQRRPNEVGFRWELAFQHIMSGNSGAAITSLEDLVDQYPFQGDFRLALASAYRKSATVDKEISGWTKLANRHPQEPFFWEQLMVTMNQRVGTGYIVLHIVNAKSFRNHAGFGVAPVDIVYSTDNDWKWICSLIRTRGTKWASVLDVLRAEGLVSEYERLWSLSGKIWE